MPSVSDVLQKLGQTWPARLAQDAYGAATLPHDVYNSPTPVTTGQMIPRATDLVGLLAGLGGAGAEEGAAGIFGGRLSQTADHVKLSQAQQMEQTGIPRSDIWNATGWGRSAEGKWVNEIPDNNVRVRQELLPHIGEDTGGGDMMHERSGTLGEMVNHPELLEAYPFLADVPTTIQMRDGAPTGSYSRPEAGYNPNGWLTISGSNPDELNATAVHELQHAVANYEGRDVGSNPRATTEQARQLTLQQQPGTPDVTAYDAYHRNIGETEARNAAYRRSYTPDDRQTPPWYTQDVANSQQLPSPLPKPQ